jgi:glutathione synthase
MVADRRLRFCFLVAGVESQQASYGSVYLAHAAHRRGHDVRFVSVEELSFLDDNSVVARTRRAPPGHYARPADYLVALGGQDAIEEEDSLAGFHVVFLRYHPLREGIGQPASPVIDMCWRLRLGGTLVVNDPEGVRRAGGRMYLGNLPPEIRARTLVSRSQSRLKEFLRALDGPAVLKPLSPTGPEKVFYLRRGQIKNLNQIITAVTRTGYAVAQEYVPDAAQGEKRMLLLAGEPLKAGKQVAIYRRVPRLRTASDRVMNGGDSSPRQCDFGPTEARIVEILRPNLVAHGLYLVSADIAGDKLLDLNVFTPGGMHSLRDIYGIDVAEVVIAALERRVRLRVAYRTTFDPEAADMV